MKAFGHDRIALIIDEISKILILSLCGLGSVAANPVSEAIEATETMQMKWLSAEQSISVSNLKPFVTDGCSGGLSDGWFFLANNLPAFKQKLGDKPPWEQCCVDHDRVYWIGSTKNGYGIREQADKVLKQCVIDVGKQNSEQLARQTSLKQEEIQEAFNIAAEMMYQSVRIGGKPCTLFPWRWGYGWPLCKIHMSLN
jgi:hypothetical protein